MIMNQKKKKFPEWMRVQTSENRGDIFAASASLKALYFAGCDTKLLEKWLNEQDREQRSVISKAYHANYVLDEVGIKDVDAWIAKGEEKEKISEIHTDIDSGVNDLSI